MASLLSHPTLIFYIHYLCIASGFCGASILLGVYLKEYSDATQSEIGVLLMSVPFLSTIVKPYFSALADKYVAHKSYLVGGLTVVLLAYVPFIALPFFPAFYKVHPRFCWWMLAFFSEIGWLAIGFAWSLGDTLSVNAAMRTGSSFGRIRIMATVSWGVYGWVIGQINETPLLPKFVPVYIILTSSTLFEIILILLWDDSVFVIKSGPELHVADPSSNAEERIQLRGVSSPLAGSVAGSMRLDKRTGRALGDLLAADDINERLKNLAKNPGASLRHRGQALDLSKIDADLEMNESSTVGKAQQKEQDRNLQAILLKMISREDGRLIKYLWLYVMFGIAWAPYQFLFLTLEDATKGTDYNFSNLVGLAVISQAAIESIAFYIMPWLSKISSQTTLLVIGMLVIAARSLFYGYFYYTSDISLYWVVIAEWGHGIPFSIYVTLQAEIALMFANQCARFIPQLIKLGILSDPSQVGQKKARAEEESIKTMLRATMNAIFSGANDGFGQGVGCLICGLVYDHFGYVNLWKIMFYITIATVIIHLIVEATRSHYSDSCEKYNKPLPEAKLKSLCNGSDGSDLTGSASQN